MILYSAELDQIALVYNDYIIFYDEDHIHGVFSMLEYDWVLVGFLEGYP